MSTALIVLGTLSVLQGTQLGKSTVGKVANDQ
jgi:hypothetical protein